MVEGESTGVELTPPVEIKICSANEVSDDDLRELAFSRTQLNQQSEIRSNTSLATAAAMQNEPAAPVKRVFWGTAEGEFEYFKELQAPGNYYVIKVNNEVAGGIGIEQTTLPAPGGRTYWTITGAVVKEKYRGKKLYPVLSDFAHDEILRREPGAAIFRMSSDHKIIERIKGLPGWRSVAIDDPIDPFAQMRLREKGEAHIQQEMRDEANIHYFIFDNLPASPSTTTAGVPTAETTESSTSTTKPASSAPPESTT